MRSVQPSTHGRKCSAQSCKLLQAAGSPNTITRLKGIVLKMLWLMTMWRVLSNA